MRDMIVVLGRPTTSVNVVSLQTSETLHRLIWNGIKRALYDRLYNYISTARVSSRAHQAIVKDFFRTIGTKHMLNNNNTGVRLYGFEERYNSLCRVTIFFYMIILLREFLYLLGKKFILQSA